MTTIYDALHESHEQQRSLFRKLLRSKPGSDDRTTLFVELRTELMAHAAAEERFLYVPIMMLDAGLSVSRHALSEHHEADELLEELTTSDKSSRGWLLKARKLSEEVHHHLKEEEKGFFQVSGKLLTATQKKTLAVKYRRDYARMKKLYATKGM